MEAVCCSTTLAPTHQNRTVSRVRRAQLVISFCTACQEQALKVKRCCCCLRNPEGKQATAVLCLSAQPTERYLPASSQWLLPTASHDAQRHASAKKSKHKETWVSQRGAASYYCLLGYDTVQSGRCVQELRRYMPLPSSGQSVGVARVFDSFVNSLNATVTQH
jgi:hypothetical protein